MQMASCLVNPFACHELDVEITPTTTPQKVAVVGAGVAGLATASLLAERGHLVTLFEAQSKIGGQFNYAKAIPGKEDFNETLRYFATRLKDMNVETRLNSRVHADELEAFDHVVVCTGVVPRTPPIPGIDHPKVLSYPEAIENPGRVGKKVALIGAGGIGFDVAELLTHGGHADELETYRHQWGIDVHYTDNRGGLMKPAMPQSPREIWLLQRKATKLGDGLAKTTGWARKLLLQKRGVHMHGGVEYLKIDDQGVHVRINNEDRLIAVDSVVVCAGQESNCGLVAELTASGKAHTVIGGADVAAELDAKRAIWQATEFAVEF